MSVSDITYVAVGDTMEVVGVTGLEPVTHSLSSYCSTN